MANYLYNGVELPKLPAWQKSTYPYVTIELFRSDEGIDFGEGVVITSEQYLAIALLSKKPVIYNGRKCVLDGSSDVIQWCATNSQEFAQLAGIPCDAWAIMGAYTTGNSYSFESVLWTSTDILHTDGTVYLAASEPVPVAGSGEPELPDRPEADSACYAVGMRAMTALADAVRSATGKTERMTPEEMAKAVSAVCSVDQFWEAFHATAGASYSHKFLFAGAGWNDETFSPTESLAPVIGEGLFRECKIVDLAGILKRKNVTFDFSKMTSCDYLAYSSTITKFPLMDLSSATRLNYCFAYLLGQTINLPLKLSDSGQQPISSLFNNCAGLTELTLSGTVGQNGLNLQWSTKLSKDSVESVVNALSSSTSGLTVTFSKTAKETAFTDEEWAALIATKSNWTISLA